MTMLRRRGRKGPKPRPSPVEKPAGSRRRARPQAVIPEALKVRNAPPAEEAKVRKPHDLVLVTGFDPFGGEKTNPSWDICKRLPKEIAGMQVETCRVPCEFRRSIEVVAAAIERHHPALVICLGLAGGRSRLGVERVAINVDDARIPDNAGMQPIDEMIAPNGPPAYFASLPVKAMAAAMREVGVPAEVSNSAGTYVCNHLMYGVLHFLAASGHRARAGFIHVPYSESQVLDKRDVPAMSLETMVKGVETAIATARMHRHDIREPEGTLS